MPLPASSPARHSPWSESAVLAEALALLTLSSLAIRLLPFRRVVDLAAGLRHRQAAPRPAGGRAIGKVVWAVTAWGRRVPWRTVCFQQGLAVHLMLRRRGIASFLHYGIARAQPKGLEAHVWVTVDEEPVIGGEEAPKFSCLATYPASRD
jgi:hypothetical protein